MLNIDFLFMDPRCVTGRTLVFLAWKHRLAQHSGFYGHSEMQGVLHGDVERRCWPSFFFHHQDVQSKKWKHPWYKNMQWSFHTNYYRVALFGVWSTYPHKGVLRPRIKVWKYNPQDRLLPLNVVSLKWRLQCSLSPLHHAVILFLCLSFTSHKAASFSSLLYGPQ